MVHVLPESQTVQPLQLVPPHWAHLAAVQPDVGVAVAEEAVLVAGALEVVGAAEVLDGTADADEEEDEPPPVEPAEGFLFSPRRHYNHV